MFNIAVNQLIECLNLCREQASTIESIGDEIKCCLESGNKVMTIGNGGSAADATHMAEELLGKFNKQRPALPAISLAADAALITCIGNDYGFEKIFSNQVEGLGKLGDVLVAFTTSGNSVNIANALKSARKHGIKTVALMGKNGGMSKGLADYELIVPSDITARIQEVHALVFHYWLERIEENLDWIYNINQKKIKFSV